LLTSAAVRMETVSSETYFGWPKSGC